MPRPTRIARITNGEPLTYEKINEIIDKFNNLVSAFNPTLNNTVVSFGGRGVNSKGNSVNYGDSNNMRVFVGSKEINPSSNKTTFNFTLSGFDTVPNVVASVRYDKKDQQEQDDNAENNSNIPSVALTISNVTTTGFKIDVNFISGQQKKITIDYIAIGRKSDNNN